MILAAIGGDTATATDVELTTDCEDLPRGRAEAILSDVVDATDAAIRARPECVDAVHLWVDRDGHLKLDATFNDHPVRDDDGRLLGWVSPHEARSRFLAALREAAPPHVEITLERSNRLGVY